VGVLIGGWCHCRGSQTVNYDSQPTVNHDLILLFLELKLATDFDWLGWSSGRSLR